MYISSFQKWCGVKIQYFNLTHIVHQISKFENPNFNCAICRQFILWTLGCCPGPRYWKVKPFNSTTKKHMDPDFCWAFYPKKMHRWFIGLKVIFYGLYHSKSPLGGGFKYFDFHPYLEKWSNLTSIFFKWVAQPPTRPWHQHHLGNMLFIFFQATFPSNSKSTFLRGG